MILLRVRWLQFCGCLLVTNFALAREVQLLDDAWRFQLGEITQASEQDFADGEWRVVDLPHDWSIEGKTDPDAPSGGDGGYFPTGIGWYRKELVAKPEWRGKQVWLDFEGVATLSQVWLNGELLEKHHYAYTPIHVDITEYLDFEKPNVIAVRVDNSKQPNSRWYTGSGIYRHVWLTVVEPVHFEHKQLGVTTRVTDRVPTEEGKIRTLATRVVNKSDQDCDFQIEFEILSGDGSSVFHAVDRQTVKGKQTVGVSKDFDTALLKPWSPEEPNLYKAIARVIAEGDIIDEVALPFGIRTVEVSPEKGLLLNGQLIELIGGCVHHDNGPLGAAAFDRAEERRVELLKAAGFNAIRTSHNPPSTAFLDACDRLGMLVIDEAFDGWAAPKKKHDYSTVFEREWSNDLRAMIDRDRNHPSVIMWSIGNEVYERGNRDGQRLARQLSKNVKIFGRYRPVTMALNGLEKKEDWPKLDPMFAALDIAGYNYELHRHAEDHKRVPKRVMYSSESFPSAAFESWQAAKHYPYVIGDFVWSGLDYLGEASIGRAFPPEEPVRAHWEGQHYPWHGAYCGDLDLTGWRKPISHYRNIIWDRGEKLYAAVVVPTPDGRPWGLGQWALPPALPSWTWPGQEDKPLMVEVYSRHEAVRLYLNDKLLGEQPTTEAEAFRAIFKVPYVEGKLRAVGIKDGEEVEEFVLATGGEPRGIRLQADHGKIKADNQDLVFISVEVTDEQGNLRPDSENAIEYTLTGPGRIVAVGSGDLASQETYQANPRRVYQGRALVVVRATREPGTIELTARADGLETSTVRVESQSVSR
jgi:beta-galactosidase